MASREKKPTTSKKQTAESLSVAQKESSQATATLNNQSEVKRIIRSRKINPVRNVKKKVGKKVIALSLKAKDKKKMIPKKIVRVLLNDIDIKKNGMTLPPKRIIKKKKPEASSVPTEQASVDKKTKKSVTSASINPKPVKTESVESLAKIDETIDSILQRIKEDEGKVIETTKIKKVRVKKPKVETPKDTISETIEEVMKDLTTLLKNEELAAQVALTKKPEEKKVEPPITLEDNIEFDASAKQLIDMLDLSVSKTQEKTTLPVECVRRHSIEKVSDSLVTALNSNVSRSNISKINRTSKVRASIDGIVRRYNPYQTRSDAPAKKLRNGKPRKMKENLLEGLIEINKRRKRLGSEHSGSEKSKISGYDSDSSRSDLSASLSLDTKKDLKILTVNGMEDDLKSESLTDDNSNLCNNLNDTTELSDSIVVDPPEVPEKSIILDTVNSTFKETISDNENKVEDILVICPKQFYGVSPKHEASIKLEPESALTPEDNVELKDELSLQSPKPNPQFIIEEAILQSKVEEIIKSMEEDDFTDLPLVETVVENPPPQTDAEQIESVEITEGESKIDALNEEPGDEFKFILNDKQIGEEHIQTESNGKIEPLENIANKESILEALGLQSLKAVEEAKLKEKAAKPDYTGSLKTVIKINRVDKNKRRNIFKLSSAYKYDIDVPDQASKLKENLSTWKTHSNSAQSSDTAGAPRKSHNSNRINMDGSSEHNSDGDTVAMENDEPHKILVIPEKASSFSVHPGRICKDECTYCFGKFGLFDTPCHIAQMKSVERQNKILEAEKHLTRDSCLCDACYRHVDRKSNTPSYSNKGSKRNSIIAPGPRQNHCHVLSCTSKASHILRRKWIIKMRKSISKLINIDLDNLGLHSIPICNEHYQSLEHLMVCAMCKRRLTRNQIHYLGAETNDLNTALNAAGIPVKLFDKPVVCKLCRYFASLILRPAEDRPENTNTFFRDYRKRLLHFHNIDVMDEDEEDGVEEEEDDQSKDKQDTETFTKKRKRLHKSTNNIGPPVLEPQVNLENLEPSRNAQSESKCTEKSRSESPSDYMVDYNTLIPSIAMECGSDQEASKKVTKVIKNKSVRLTSNASISVRELFPGEEELGLQCHINFGHTKEKTLEGWEKCSSVIQYDNETKILWQELQKPYGNQSSFLRHLILLEKYFRSGDLVLTQNASHQSVHYSQAVQNRLRAYDNIPKDACATVNHSTSQIITANDASSIINAANIPKNTPITITQINNITPTIVNKTRVPPPGLISLHPGTTRPKTPVLIKPQPNNKIKIPLTKNWRPNLIPIDPSKKSDKKPGYVKVVSNGKPYHITVDDYNRMCAIKKSYDLKQKRLHEAAQAASISHQSIKNISIHGKGITISKASPTKMETESDITFVENHENKLASMVSLPKIPKSLIVIPQTVTQKSSPPPSLTITPSTSKS